MGFSSPICNRKGHLWADDSQTQIPRLITKTQLSGSLGNLPGRGVILQITSLGLKRTLEAASPCQPGCVLCLPHPGDRQHVHGVAQTGDQGQDSEITCPSSGLCGHRTPLLYSPVTHSALLALQHMPTSGPLHILPVVASCFTTPRSLLRCPLSGGLSQSPLFFL